VEKQPDISVLFVVLLTAFATFWSIKKILRIIPTT